MKVIEIQRQFGVDVFVRMLFGLNAPLSIHMGGLNVSQQADRWEVETLDQVRRATEETILAGKPSGGFILQPVDFLEYGTPVENVEAYVAAAKEHASY